VARPRGLALAAGALGIMGCYAQRTVAPAAVPQGMTASPVQLHLRQPVSVTGMVTQPWRKAEPPRPVHEPAATRIDGRVQWSSADSLAIAPEDIHGQRGHQPVAGMAPVRLAWSDVARVEQRKLSPGRTVGAAVGSTLLVIVAAIVVVAILIDPYSPSS
jgi:hypothetical protein